MAVLLAGGTLFGAASAQEAAAPPGLELQPSLKLSERLPGGKDMGGPSFLLGDHIEGQTDVETRVEGHAELRRHEMTLRADRLQHRSSDDTVHASGNVHINRLGNLYDGPELQLKLDTYQGYFLQPRYSLINGGRGEAARMDFIDEDRARAEDAIYSTCERPPAGTEWLPDWWISAQSIEFDRSTNIATASNGVVHFKGVPILAAPYATFPISSDRMSGLLPPTVNITNQSGVELLLPYYLNLAPQRDATLLPNLMSTRGVDLGAEFRYLEPTYTGEWRGAYMPNDKLRDADRWSASLQHRQNLSDPALPGNLGLRLNLNHVSDDNYWRDFPHAGRLLTQRLLPTEAVLSWNRGDWSAVAGSYRWQTLQDPLAPITTPYDRLPSLAARYAPTSLTLGGVPDWNWSFNTELTRFSSSRATKIWDGVSSDTSTVLDGTRALAVAQFGKTWREPGWYVKPALQLHLREYQFEQALGNGQTSPGLALPTVSLDSGMFFERDTSFFGRALTQTLEPRLYYTHTPYREQRFLPTYDSAPFDFTLATAFLSNPYVGQDRVADLNAVTLGATTRLLHPETGAELLSLGLAQRYRFTEQRIGMPGEAPVAAGLTDLLLGGRVQWTPQWSANGTIQYNPDTGASTRSTLGMRYNPGYYRVLNAAYRINRSTTPDTRLLDVGWQWPLQDLFGKGAPAGSPGRGLGASQWYGVGRFNYSLPDSKIIDLLAGFEYDAGCWLSRVVVERLQSSTNSSNQRIMFQLEFSDFTRIGSSPLQSLRNNVPRYQLLREEINPPSRFERYE